MDEIIKLITQSLRSFKGYEASKCIEHEQALCLNEQISMDGLWIKRELVDFNQNMSITDNEHDII